MARKPDPPAGAPEWLVTYGDCMGLLLCFFIVMVSMSEVKENERFQQVMESLRRAFGGGYEGAMGSFPIQTLSTNSLIEKLMELELANVDQKPGETDAEGILGKKFRVTNVRDGLQIVVGGRITFDRFSATLKPEARDLVAKTAERLRGYNTKILVRGHATREPLPDDSLYDDAYDLSYARARAVAAELEGNGVRRVRLIPVAVGDAEPLVRQAYTEERRALNRRVEILVTEDLVDDYAGSTLATDLMESSDGR